ncbi:MAG: hypothetical protein MJ069_08060 [Salinivirgaceae bacterium]|nr:hypothetical protein [Salinivirgaceae bacterium]
MKRVFLFFTLVFVLFESCSINMNEGYVYFVGNETDATLFLDIESNDNVAKYTLAPYESVYIGNYIDEGTNEIGSNYGDQFLRYEFDEIRVYSDSNRKHMLMSDNWENETTASWFFGGQWQRREVDAATYIKKYWRNNEQDIDHVYKLTFIFSK